MNFLSLKTIIVTIATFVSATVGVHAPVPVTTPVQTLSPEMSSQIDAYVAKITAPRLGAAPSPAALHTYTLAGAGVSSSATSITLTSLTIKQTGQKIRTSDLVQGGSDSFYVTLEPGNTSRQEIVGCTTVTQNGNGSATLSGCSRGLSPIYPYTASTTLRFTHGGSSQVIFGDAPQIFNDFNNYIASAIVSGAVDSSATVKGIVEKATGAEAAAHAAIGSGNTTAPLTLTTDIASSTRTANTAQVVIASSTDGYIDNSFISTTTLFRSINLSGTTTVATSTSYFLNGIALIDIGKQFKAFTTTGSTTFAVPSGVKKLHYRITGGGGDGGGASSGGACASGAGGSAGGYSEGFMDVTSTTSLSIFIGTKDQASRIGTTTNWYITANPGIDGAAGNNGNVGGTAVGGDINIDGGASQGGAGTAAGFVGGMGGSNPLGMGGGGGGCPAAGQTATGFGGGGGGAAATSGSGAQGGGAGTQGGLFLAW